MAKASAQSRTLQLPRMRMSRVAPIATEPGSSGFALQAPTELASRRVAKSTQSPASSPSASSINSSAAVELARELGESTRPRKSRTFRWAMKQLHRGCLIARHGFALEESPKQLYYRLEGSGTVELLVLVCENAEFETGTFVYADVEGRDWYVVNQLELAK